jgi:hypothetical protein
MSDYYYNNFIFYYFYNYIYIMGALCVAGDRKEIEEAKKSIKI